MDALGLIIAVVVMAASATDNQIGVTLIDRVVAHTPTVSKAWVDAGFKDDVAIHGALNGIDVEQVLRSDSRAGFVPIAKRWIVEQVKCAARRSVVSPAQSGGTRREVPGSAG